MKRSLCPVLLILLALCLGCGSTGNQVVTSEPVTDVREAAVPEPTPMPEGDEEPVVNTLKWTTASEVDNFGFDIYRSLDEDGPFEKITDRPMAGAGTTDEPQRYEFVDDDIDPSRDYYYYIESISLGGIREKFSPVIRAPAKRPIETND